MCLLEFFRLPIILNGWEYLYFNAAEIAKCSKAFIFTIQHKQAQDAGLHTGFFRGGGTFFLLLGKLCG